MVNQKPGTPFDGSSSLAVSPLSTTLAFSLTFSANSSSSSSSLGQSHSWHNHRLIHTHWRCGLTSSVGSYSPLAIRVLLSYRGVYSSWYLHSKAWIWRLSSGNYLLDHGGRFNHLLIKLGLDISRVHLQLPQSFDPATHRRRQGCNISAGLKKEQLRKLLPRAQSREAKDNAPAR